MVDNLEILKRRLQREKNIRLQVEKIAEERSRELYLKNVELQNALLAESNAKKELETLYKKVDLLSRTDPLTGLNNRRHFSSTAEFIFKLAIRERKNLSCAMLDIDYFKNINDTYGHSCGDLVLTTVAGTCRKQLRESDLLARFGGEEFSFLFTGADMNFAALIADRLRQDIANLPFSSSSRLAGANR